MKRELRLPTILGVLVAFSGLLAGLVLVRTTIGRSTQASAEETPSDVRITNITDTAFTVSWVTARDTSGFVQYGPAGTEPDLVVSDERDLRNGSVGNYFTHYVNVQGLTAATEYEFKLGSGRGTFGQNGDTTYKIKTGPAIANAPAADVAYGQVNTASGEPADGALLYVELTGAAKLSALVKTSGSWVIPLSTARTADLSSYLEYDHETTVLELTALDGQGGTSVVTAVTRDDSPLTTIVLGTNASLANITPTESPAATPSGQPADDGGSKFSGEAGETVVLLAPKFGEESVARPEIVGKAPANTQITIEVNSETQITTTVTSDADGNFSFVVPADLEPGEHTVTITAIVDGVVKKITRSFVVLAAEPNGELELTASPSASPTTAAASPTPTRTSSPTPTSAVTTTITPAATIRPTSTPTNTPMPTVMIDIPDDELPVTGDGDWIWLFVGVGGAFMLGGMAILAL